MVFVGNNPILLFVGSVPNSVVALTEIVDKNGNDVIVIVHINKRHKRNVINKIASVYSKSDEQGNNKIINYVKQQIDAGNLVDASIKKAPIWFTTRGLQLPKVVQTIIDANNTVPQKVQTVNNNDMQKDKKDNTKYSRALSSETKEKVLNAYDIVNLNDSIEVQRKVFSALQKNGFFTDEARTRRIDVNEETGMEIETNKSGINETFSYKNFVVNSNETKIIKLATITSLPSIIQKGKIIENDVPHAKNTNSSATYAYLLGSVYIDNIPIDVKVTVRKSPRKNKFWVHHIYIKNDTAVASGEYENRESPALQTNGVNESVSQPPVEVKDKYSRQFVNDTWEGIRDMMYENDVHQEVITEIEGYIKKLRRRNLSRETALTEGLIMADRIVCHISHIIKYKNDIFIDGRRQDAVKWSNEVRKKMDKHKQKDSYPFVLPGLNAEYGMLTPIYFLRILQLIMTGTVL